jgi:DNA-binding MarR family transcriptional regulator
MSAFRPRDHTGYLLRRAQQLHAQLWSQQISAEITPVQFGVLALARDQPGIDQKTVADRLNLDRSTITEVVVRLTRRGFLDRTRTDDDRRRNALILTGEGLAAVEQLDWGADAADEALASGLTAAEHRQLDDLLRRVVDRSPSSGSPETADQEPVAEEVNDPA